MGLVIDSLSFFFVVGEILRTQGLIVVTKKRSATGELVPDEATAEKKVAAVSSPTGVKTE